MRWLRNLRHLLPNAKPDKLISIPKIHMVEEKK